MLPYVESTQFSIGPLVIHTWGLCAAVGVGAASYVAYRLAKNRKLTPDTMLDLVFWSLVAAFAGARIGYVFNAWDEFRGDPAAAFRIWEGGMASWGGIVGVLIVLAVFVRVRRIDLWQYADVIVIAATLGLTFGRVGCALIHDHLGRVTTVPWGIDVNGIIRHEPSYYLVLFNLALFLILYRFAVRRTLRKGLLTAGFLVFYGLGRLFFDTFRAADLVHVDPRFLHLTVAQYFFLIQILVGLGMLVYLQRKNAALIST